jgi:heme A synthase
MGSPPPSTSVWVEWFDRFVARWLFAFIALSALGLALLAVATHG